MPQFGDIPAWCVKFAPIPWELELQAGLELPLKWGGFDIPPLAMGTLSLFECAGCKFLKSPANVACLFDILRPAYIAIHREKCLALCLEHRSFHAALAGEFSDTDSSTWSPLDRAVALFFKGIVPVELEPERVLSLWSFFDVSFEGFSMINGADGVEPMEWLYGLDSVASYLKAVSSVCHDSRFELLWRFPVALGAHLIAAACRENPKIKVYRRPDKAHRDRLAAYGVNTEGIGKLTYWQKMWPDRYDLSEVQVIRGGDALAKEFNALRLEVAELPEDVKETRRLKILQEEGVA